MNQSDISQKLTEKGMRVTPQRVAILEAATKLRNHPSAESIIAYIKKKYPNISVGTVYKVLDSLVENQLLNRVRTENGVMRFDAMLERHHHLHCNETDRIEDYEDEKLDKIITDYFKSKGLKDFEIKDFKLQITGTFKKGKELL